MQELVELAGVDAGDRLLARDEPFLDHLGGDPQGRGSGALARAGLQEVQRPFLDRELDVLHVAVVHLEPVERRHELVERLRHALLHTGDRLGRPDPGDDVLALRVREELAEELPLPGRGVASEADTRARALAAVPEDHLDDVHRGSEVVGDVVRAAVDLRARRVPGVEDRPVGAAQLLARVLRERLTRSVLVDRLEGLHELTEVVGGEIDVLVDATRGLELGQRMLETVTVDAVDDVAVHLDEPAVRVERETRIAGRGGEAFDGHVVQAEVEDRVHHPRHRDRRARADGHEQRAPVVAEALLGARLERGDVLVHLGIEAVGDGAARGHVRTARLRRDGETGRYGNAELGHLGEADPLSAEELPTAVRVLDEIEDVAHLRGESTRTRQGAETRMVAWSSLPGRSPNRMLVWPRCGLGIVASRGNDVHSVMPRAAASMTGSGGS